jgi:anti-sigma-K factor RskA
VEPNLTVARHAATRDLLGAFALGAVDAEEAAAVRAHLATCAECQAEMAELWLAVDSLPGMIEPVEPPPALRDRIAVAVMAEAASPSPAPPAVSVAPPPEPAPTAVPAPPAPEPVRKPASFWSRATPWAVAAAILLLLSTGLLVWNLRMREQLATAPVVETIALAPTDAAPQAGGEVTYLPQDDLFILEVRDLPPLEPDQVYEVWLIGANGPEPAGVFDQSTDQHAIVADRDRYDSLAITAEPGPLGTAAPTGEIVATAPLQRPAGRNAPKFFAAARNDTKCAMRHSAQSTPSLATITTRRDKSCGDERRRPGGS